MTMPKVLSPGARVRSWKWRTASPAGWTASRVPTGGRELAQEPLVLAVDPRREGPRKQDDLVALMISVVYRPQAIPGGWHIVGPRPGSPGLTTSAVCCGWPRPCRPRCRCAA